jgi:hypothetical protein
MRNSSGWQANVSFENEAFRIVLADAQCIELPTWTRAGNGQLHSLQVIRTLLNLTVQQPQIEMLHRRYAGDSNKMSESHWLEFMHTEQASPAGRPSSVVPNKCIA